MTDQPRSRDTRGLDTRGRDARSTDITSGLGVPSWLAVGQRFCGRCGTELRFGAIDGEMLPIGSDSTVWLTEADARGARMAGYIQISV